MRGDGPIRPHRLLRPVAPLLCALLLVAPFTSAITGFGPPDTGGIVENVLLRFSGPLLAGVGAPVPFFGEFAVDARMRAPVEAGTEVPLADQEVLLVLDEAAVIGRARTDAEGRFTVAGIIPTPGPHVLRAVAEVGWRSHTIEVLAVARPEAPSLTLQREGWDAHRVAWSTPHEGGRPVTSATFTLRDANGAVVTRSTQPGGGNASGVAWATSPGIFALEVVLNNAAGASDPTFATLEVLPPPAGAVVTRDSWSTWLSSTACCFEMPDGHTGQLAADAHPVSYFFRHMGNVTGPDGPLAGVAVHGYARWTMGEHSGEIWARGVSGTTGAYAVVSERATLPSPANGECRFVATKMVLSLGEVVEQRDGGFTLCRDA